MQAVSSYLNNEAKNNLSAISFRLLNKETPGTKKVKPAVKLSKKIEMCIMNSYVSVICDTSSVANLGILLLDFAH